MLGERVALPMRDALSNTAVRDLWSEWGKGVDPNSSMVAVFKAGSKLLETSRF